MATEVIRVGKTGIVSCRAQVRIVAGHRSVSATFDRRADAIRWGGIPCWSTLGGLLKLPGVTVLPGTWNPFHFAR